MHPLKYNINCRGKLIDLSEPKVMGIINITPDSFYTQSRSESSDELLKAVERMINDGADIIDIGGYSSRPGADFVDEQTEAQRVLPAIDKIMKSFPELILSVDTYRSAIARQSIIAGASIINDISAGEEDDNMYATVAAFKNIPYVMMHKKGNPQNMQQYAQYNDVVLEVADYFASKIAMATQVGIKDLILDPGFGFAKQLHHNYTLLNQLDYFEMFNYPLMVGVSRKKMIQQVVSANADGALNGTSVVHTIALLKGARILRTHDVKEAAECIKIVKALNGNI